jgi:hypothetical protein
MSFEYFVYTNIYNIVQRNWQSLHFRIGRFAPLKLQYFQILQPYQTRKFFIVTIPNHTCYTAAICEAPTATKRRYYKDTSIDIPIEDFPYNNVRKFSIKLILQLLVLSVSRAVVLPRQTILGVARSTNCKL